MELREGWIQLIVRDVLAVDLQVLEEGLVEKAPLERVGV